MSLIAWRSGRRAARPVLRLLPVILLALAISAAFGMASIFSARVTTETANEVLLKGTRCGSFDKWKPNSRYLQLTTAQPFYAERANRFLNYGMQCYTDRTRTDGCNQFVRPRLPLSVNRSISCPFPDDICKMPMGNLELDTGYINSHHHLGVNAPPKDRFEMRILQRCAPIKTKEYMSDYTDSDYGPVARYYYGPVRIENGTFNVTYELPIDYAYLPSDGASSATVPRLEYDLG